MAGRAGAALTAASFEEEARVDPTDGCVFTLRELLAMHELLGTDVERRVVEDYWRDVCRLDPGQRRVDPADGEACSLDEFRGKYAGQFDETQCQDYFRAVMPRACPMPGRLRPQGRRTGPGSSVCALPFAAAALWASALPEAEACDGDFHSTGGTSPFAILSAWRYAVNNLRLAIGVLPPQDAAGHWGSLLGVRRAVAALEAFGRQPSTEGFTRAVACSKAALRSWREWLQAQSTVEVEVSLDAGSGVSFLPGGRSCPVPASAAEHKALLHGGKEIPLVGFGTWQMVGNDAYTAVLAALQAGYRHVDTAQLYQNEREVGRALRDSGVPRTDLFLATKLSDVSCFQQPRATVEGQLRDLGTDYVDLYMLHQATDRETVRSAWQTLEVLHAEGKIRALGVSNFGLRELQDLLEYAKVPPAYLQNKFNVYAPGEQRVSSDDSVLAFARERGMQFFGYSVNNPWPGVLRPMEDPHVLAIAARHRRTPAQVLLRWALQLGVGVLPKSTSEGRIRENAALFDFRLSDLDVRLLTGLVTLAESAGALHAPAWVEDIYILGRLDE